MNKVYAGISGSVEYDLSAAERPIDEMIEALIYLRYEEGVTHVVGETGNYRGAQYTTLSADLLDTY